MKLCSVLMALLSMRFSRQEYWNGLLFPSPDNLPNPGIQLGSPSLQEDSLLSEPPGKPPKITSLQFLEMNLKKKENELWISCHFTHKCSSRIKKGHFQT